MKVKMVLQNLLQYNYCFTCISQQTVQTQMSSLIRVYTVCNSSCIFWVHYSLVKPSFSNFRAIIANFWGVRIFRSFMVTHMCLAFHFLGGGGNFGKQCRPRSDATEHGVWSGSLLFAQLKELFLKLEIKWTRVSTVCITERVISKLEPVSFVQTCQG